jgi:hypothetical protein
MVVTARHEQHSRWSNEGSSDMKSRVVGRFVELLGLPTQ